MGWTDVLIWVKLNAYWWRHTNWNKIITRDFVSCVLFDISKPSLTDYNNKEIEESIINLPVCPLE